jgi:hypothetical protein
MDKSLKQELVIDFKAEMKNPRGRPKREPDWDNKNGPRIKVSTPGDGEQIKTDVLRILKNCVARLEGTEPRKAWEPRSKSWPYTSMGLALVKAIDLIDTLADRAKAEPET